MDRSPEDDLAILRHFEPVVRFTRGERFFPMEVERYIKQCSLWVQRPEEPPEQLVVQGELTVDRLVQPREDRFGAVYFLKFIEPLDLLELARYSLNQAVKTFTHQDPEEIFRSGRGRLARVGYASRFVDALFSLTLYIRGRVPGDTAAAAALTYQKMQQEWERYCYYGRVVRENGWVCLQYWFFYPFNNWRSGFFGGNDHEGDWEMIYIYCSETGASACAGPDPGLTPEGCLAPRWVAYASHDFSGDDLRRRWDDPEVEKVSDEAGGLHPVIYAGAGSHASYFSPGEFLSELELPFLRPLIVITDKIQLVWDNLTRQSGNRNGPPAFNVFRVPFVDYARGDGLSIGPGQKRTWESCLLGPATSWAFGYRGLWGLYARDPISGENAPAGPVYNRDGSVRRSWYDPLGWAGLDKVPTPEQALAVLDEQRRAVEARRDQLEATIRQKNEELVGLGVELSAMQGASFLEGLYTECQGRINCLAEEVAGLRRQLTLEETRLQAFKHHAEKLARGDFGPLRAHIHRAYESSSEIDLRLGRLAETFAAVSIGLVMVGLVLLIVLARHYLVFGLAAMIGLLIFIEAGFRRRLARLLTSLVTGLAIVSAFILLFEFFWPAVVASVLIAGLYIMWENLREIRA